MMRTLQPFLFLCLIACLLISGCSKDPMDNPPDNPSFRGNFVSSAHTTSGIASIDQGMTKLTLTNLQTDNGPDLNIYLSSSISNVTSDFIDLGDNKGVNGSYEYDLPGNINFTTYKYVVVWCVDFDVNFGYAELIEQ